MTGLFLRAAYYERRVHVTSGLCQGCLVAEVSQRWYAHRSRQNLMVMELNITYYGGSASALPPLLLLLNNTIGGPSPDLKTESLPPPSDIARGCADMALPSLHCLLPVNTSITIAETNTPEIQGGGTFTVAWAADTVPETIEVNSSIPPHTIPAHAHHSSLFPRNTLRMYACAIRVIIFLVVLVGSRSPGCCCRRSAQVTLLELASTTTARVQLTAAHSARSSRPALLAEHSKQWASEWQQGSVTVSGNQRLSCAINSSLYYLMSSSSPHLPLSLSPGGLASNGMIHIVPTLSTSQPSHFTTRQHAFRLQWPHVLGL
jgi:hypothetical protein